MKNHLEEKKENILATKNIRFVTIRQHMDFPVPGFWQDNSDLNVLPENDLVKEEEGRVHTDSVVEGIGASADFIDSLMQEIEDFKILRNPDYFEDSQDNKEVADYTEIQNIWDMVDGINRKEEGAENFDILGVSTTIEIYEYGSLDLSGLDEPPNAEYEMRLVMHETPSDPDSYWENKNYWYSEEVLVATINGYIGSQERRTFSETYLPLFNEK
jgi:hypothetical protein